MTDRQPSEVTNLDRYGDPVLRWSGHMISLRGRRGHSPVSSGHGPADGRARAGSARCGTMATFISPVGGTRKARNLASNPACTISVKLPGMDLTLDGTAVRVTEPTVLEQVASIYRDIGWQAEVTGDAFTAPYSAPSARATAVASLPVHFPHGRRFEHRRAEWRDTLAVRSLTTPRALLNVDVDVLLEANDAEFTVAPGLGRAFRGSVQGSGKHEVGERGRGQADADEPGDVETAESGPPGRCSANRE